MRPKHQKKPESLRLLLLLPPCSVVPTGCIDQLTFVERAAIAQSTRDEHNAATWGIDIG